MIRVALDTNVYSKLAQNDPRFREIVRVADEVHLSSIVLGEIRAGFLLGNKTEQNERVLQKYLEGPRVFIDKIDANTAHHYAVLKRLLRDEGKPIPSNDLWIAASAIQHQLSLLTLDAHFSYIPLLARVFT